MKDLIYDQRAIPKRQWRYGLRSSAATGCGWIATYNALRLMGYEAQPEVLVRAFARQIPLINGNLGTMLFSPAWMLRKWGFRVRCIMDPRKFDGAAANADACVLFYRWINFKQGRAGAHFVALHHTPEGFVGYNTYRGSTGPNRYGKSLAAFLKRRKYFTPVLFAVGKAP